MRDFDFSLLSPPQRDFIGALLSGDYEQEQGRLRSRAVENRMCCLGVACDRFDSSRWRRIEPDKQSTYLYEGKSGTLPMSVMERLGLDSNNPILYDTLEHGEVGASTCNDTLNLSFQQIAALFFYLFTTSRPLRQKNIRLNHYTREFLAAWEQAS